MQADFAPFVGKASLREQAADAAALAQAAFAGHVPEAPAGKGAADGEAPNTSADADLALALQMQEVGCSCQGAVIAGSTLMCHVWHHAVAMHNLSLAQSC